MPQFLHSEVDPAASGEPVEAAETPAEEAPWSLGQEEYEQLGQAVSYLIQREQAREAEQNGERQPLDPYADDFEDRLGQMLDERMRPFQEQAQRFQSQEDIARQFDVLADNEAREGEFLIRESSEECPVSSNEAAIALHYAFLDEAIQRYGNTPRAQEAALTQAYKVTRQWEEAVAKAALSRRDNQLQTLTGAPREPAAGAAEGTQVSPRGGDEMSVLRRHFPVRGPLPAA